MISAVRSLRRKLRFVPKRLLYDPRTRYGPLPRLLSRLRRWRLQLMHPHATLVFQGPVYVGPHTSLFIPDRGTLIVGPNVEFRRGFRGEILQDGRVEIGADCVFSHEVLLQCTKSITIGDRCHFGQSCLLVDGQHHVRDMSGPLLETGYDWRPLVIEDDAAVGSQCAIMASLGRRVFVGVNSVVTRDIPAYSLAIGSPARVVEKFDSSQAG